MQVILKSCVLCILFLSGRTEIVYKMDCKKGFEVINLTKTPKTIDKCREREYSKSYLNHKYKGTSTTMSKRTSGESSKSEVGGHGEAGGHRGHGRYITPLAVTAAGLLLASCSLGQDHQPTEPTDSTDPTPGVAAIDACELKQPREVEPGDNIMRTVSSSPQEIHTLSTYAGHALRTDIGVFTAEGGSISTEIHNGAIYKLKVVDTDKAVKHIYAIKTWPTTAEEGRAVRCVETSSYYEPEDRDLIGSEDPSWGMPFDATTYKLSGEASVVAEADTVKEISKELDKGTLAVEGFSGPYSKVRVDGYPESTVQVVLNTGQSSIDLMQGPYDLVDNSGETIATASDDELRDAALQVATTRSLLN